MNVLQVYFNVTNSELKDFQRGPEDKISQPFKSDSTNIQVEFLDNYHLTGHFLFDLEKLTLPQVITIQNKIKLNKGKVCLTFTSPWGSEIVQQRFQKSFGRSIGMKNVHFKDFKKCSTVFQRFPKLRSELVKLDILTRIEAARIFRDTERSNFQTTLLYLATDGKTTKESYEISRHLNNYCYLLD